jgi:tetratricopeptide (TPR) repeat protein
VKKAAYIILACLIFSGCTTIKQGWKDFTAYYNTFYNAKYFYSEGLNKNQRQTSPINPLQPIRIHDSPTNAGLADFDLAIERGSSILRNHEDSKYVLPAIELIGKSYYYRSEFFSALEKFQELATLANGDLRGTGILWQGLTYLEMSNFNEGIRFLEIETEISQDWNSNLLAEIDAVLAQLHVAVGNHEQSIEYLQRSIPGLDHSEMKARGYFLLGQNYETLELESQALFAFSQVNDLRVSFDLEFNAKRKQAEVSRRIGNYDFAELIYRQLSRDDKFFEFRNDLQYEIARTQQIRGNAENAIISYYQVLRDRLQPPGNLTRAKTYFGIGEIYRDQLNNYSLAAAYFDSAASQRVDIQLLPQNFNARELADSFGQYAAIRSEITRKDSLIGIANLKPEELEALIQELQQIELEKIETELNRIQQQRDRMIVADETGQIVDAETEVEYGFLNNKSLAMLADASLQFQAVWGDRPLADNWRRRADVSGSRFDQIVLTDTEDEVVTIVENNASIPSLKTVDLSGIPFEEEEQEAMKQEIIELQYRLANVFFMSLDKPDSAKVYYQNVVEESSQKNLVTMSLYTLAEIELLQNNSERAVRWFDKLNEVDPYSIYSQRLSERLNIEFNPAEAGENLIVEKLYHEVISGIPDTLAVQRAEELKKLAEKGSGDSQRALLLFEAAREYMKAAQESSGLQDSIRSWFAIQDSLVGEKNEFSALIDSSRIMLQDDTLTEEETRFWQQVADSTFLEPDLTGIFPFEGAYWDSTRSILARIETNYTTAEVMPRVQILKKMLEKPVIEITNEEQEPDTNEYPEGESISMNADTLPACEDLGFQVDIEGGIQGFMDLITYPAWTQNMSVRGEISYFFEVNSDGTILNYEQIEGMDRSGIPQSIESAIDQLLSFTPTDTDTDTVQCTFIFPIDF